MSSEENMQWKQKEEQSKDHVEDQREKINEIEEVLFAEGPYNDQIVIDDENVEELSVFSSEEINQCTIDEQEDQDLVTTHS